MGDYMIGIFCKEQLRFATSKQSLRVGGFHRFGSFEKKKFAWLIKEQTHLVDWFYAFAFLKRAVHQNP